MKKIFFSSIFFLCHILLFPQYITLKDRQLVDSSGNKFFVKGINYVCDLYNQGSGFQVRPYFSYAPNFHYAGMSPTCTGQSTCDQTMLADFTYIKDTLGCNTVRVFISNAQPLDCSGGSTPHYTLNINNNDSGGYYTYTTSGNNGLDFVAPLYAHVLDIAASVHNGGIKVILQLFGRGGSCEGTVATIHDNYLAATAAACSTKTALLAYDEWNEPQFYDDDNYLNFTKQDVCNMTKSWYNTLKTYDPNHLVTVGLAALGFGVDDYQWSPEVYKADFFAFHIYPELNTKTHQAICYGKQVTVLDSNLDQCQVQNYVDRYNTVITWLQNTVDLPWLIGETGFRTPPGFDCGSPGTCINCEGHSYSCVADGNETDQRTFLINSLTQTIQAGGMGMVWWNFKDVPWQVPEDPSGRYYGLVNNVTGNVKLAGRALHDFNCDAVSGAPLPYPSGTCNYQNLLCNTGTLLSGTVKDSATGLPIKDATVNGWHAVGNTFSNAVQTITDANGNFNLYSETPIQPFPLSSTEVNTMLVSAVGYDKAVTSGASAASVNNKHFIISKASNTYYDVTEINLQPDFHQYEPPVTAANKLSLQALCMGCGGIISDVYPLHVFTAGREIEILPYGTTQSGLDLHSEAAFYISSVDVDCNDSRWGHASVERKAHTSGSQGSVTGGGLQSATITNTNTVKTVYLSPENNNTTVWPNPATDKVLLESEKNITFITVTDMYGKEVSRLNPAAGKRQSLDTYLFAPGVYTIKITYADNTMSYTQIIKQ